mmetsp:Transcript_30683/g.82130  ORF Transcript_30683/g.82130 Transcript_30683/m.82130 type:complete len:285 (+) Transcript_30683:147-1001(+)
MCVTRGAQQARRDGEERGPRVVLKRGGEEGGSECCCVWGGGRRPNVGVKVASSILRARRARAPRKQGHRPSKPRGSRCQADPGGRGYSSSGLSDTICRHKVSTRTACQTRARHRLGEVQRLAVEPLVQVHHVLRRLLEVARGVVRFGDEGGVGAAVGHGLEHLVPVVEACVHLAQKLQPVLELLVGRARKVLRKVRASCHRRHQRYVLAVGRRAVRPGHAEHVHVVGPPDLVLWENDLRGGLVAWRDGVGEHRDAAHHLGLCRAPAAAFITPQQSRGPTHRSRK